jgi:hypothetical protein
MSKVSDTKKKQGYVKEGPTCANCAKFTSDKEVNRWHYTIERNLRCSVGNFAVLKRSWCKLYAPKDQT